MAALPANGSQKMYDITCPHFELGVVGFEPTDVGIKTRCLTTWRNPNRTSTGPTLPEPQPHVLVLRRGGAAKKARLGEKLSEALREVLHGAVFEQAVRERGVPV